MTNDNIQRREQQAGIDDSENTYHTTEATHVYTIVQVNLSFNAKAPRQISLHSHWHEYESGIRVQVIVNTTLYVFQ